MFFLRNLKKSRWTRIVLYKWMLKPEWKRKHAIEKIQHTSIVKWEVNISA